MNKTIEDNVDQFDVNRFDIEKIPHENLDENPKGRDLLLNVDEHIVLKESYGA